MKTITLLSGIALLCAAVVSAQTASARQPASPSSRNAPQTVTLTGCVGSVSGPQGGFMLSNPLVVPPAGATATAQAGTPASTPPYATQPNAGSAVGTAGTASTGVGTAGTASTGVGAAGTASPGTAGTTGVGSNPASATGTPSGRYDRDGRQRRDRNARRRRARRHCHRRRNNGRDERVPFIGRRHELVVGSARADRRDRRSGTSERRRCADQRHQRGRGCPDAGVPRPECAAG